MAHIPGGDQADAKTGWLKPVPGPDNNPADDGMIRNVAHVRKDWNYFCEKQTRYADGSGIARKYAVKLHGNTVYMGDMG